jgi:hypothetical protein
MFYVKISDFSLFIWQSGVQFETEKYDIFQAYFCLILIWDFCYENSKVIYLFQLDWENNLIFMKQTVWLVEDFVNVVKMNIYHWTILDTIS